MRYTETSIPGVVIVDLEPRGDERGFFARLFDADEFAARGLEAVFPQISTSISVHAGTLRGLHYQVAPRGEAKLVKCLKGAIFDVVADMRAASPTFRQWLGVELSDENRRMLYVPKGCAHGFMTLANNTEVMYPASAPYAAAEERVLRWDDPAIAIAWPRAPAVLSEKDKTAPDFDVAYHGSGY
jgi:dTDP-4-dehydrorhamnose 3,5-epimerase